MVTQNFELLPAVDVLDGRAVRLAQGRREAVSLEGGDPVELARAFAADGADRIHLVDLDGAFTGSPTVGLIERVADVGLPIQVGGGYRTLEAIASALAVGADRVMVGTAALSPGFLDAALARFGAAIVVAVDARDGRVAVEGWTRSSDLAPAELARACATAGVTRLLVTSTRRDGSLEGPDLALLDDVVAVGVPVLAAGGIASIDDLEAVRALGCAGAVAGSALLTGAFTLTEARARLGS